jgi:hypothetical protein
MDLRSVLMALGGGDVEGSREPYFSLAGSSGKRHLDIRSDRFRRAGMRDSGNPVVLLPYRQVKGHVTTAKLGVKSRMLRPYHSPLLVSRLCKDADPPSSLSGKHEIYPSSGNGIDAIYSWICVTEPHG